MAQKQSEKLKAQKEYKQKQQLELNILNRNKIYTALGTIFILTLWGAVSLFQSRGYTDITDAKGFINWIICLLGFLAFGVVWCIYKLGASKTPFDFRLSVKGLTFADWGAISYLIICTVSAIISPYQEIVLVGKQGRFDGLLTQYCYIFAYFIASRFYVYKKWHGIFFACTMIFNTIVALFQYFGVDLLGLYPEGRTFANTQFLALIGNINIVSTVSSLVTVLFALMFIKYKGKMAYFYLATAICTFFLQTIAGSDSGWVSIGAGLFFTLPLIFTNRKSIMRYGIVIFSFGLTGIFSNFITEVLKNQQTFDPSSIWVLAAIGGALLYLGAALIGKKIHLKRIVAFIVMWCVVVFIIISGIVGIEIIGKTEDTGMIYQAREMLHGNLDDSFMTKRGYIWKSSFYLIQFNPIFGSGPDTLGAQHAAILGQEGPDTIGYTVDKAHNEYIQYAVCVGILGLLAYMLLIADVIIRWFKHGYKDENMDVFKFGAGGSVIAYVCQAFFNLSVPISAPYYFIMLGAAAKKQE